MPYLPEPKQEHGAIAKTAVLLVNLGTPGAPISEAVSVRPARDRNSSGALAADPARLRTQHETEEISTEIRQHLVLGRLPLEGAYREAGAIAARLFRFAGPHAALGRFRHALRRALDPGHAGSPEVGGLRARPRGADVSAIRGQHDRKHPG